MPSRLLLPDIPQQTYTSTELQKLIPKITLRQLQWWDERGVITPRHEGHRRLYGIKDALAVAIIADLRRKGLPLQRLRTVPRMLQRDTERLLSAIRGQGGRAYLAIYGKSVVIETSPGKLLDKLSAASRQCYVVDVARKLEILNPEPQKAFHATG